MKVMEKMLENTAGQDALRGSDVVLIKYPEGFRTWKNRYGIPGSRIGEVEAQRLLDTRELKVSVVDKKGKLLEANHGLLESFQGEIDSRYVVMQITRSEAVEKLEGHYINRVPKVSYAFGLFDKDRSNRLVAVVTYGSPASPTLCKGLCGEEERRNVIELNRLWAETSVSNNAMLYFLAQTLKQVEKEIVVSFVQPDKERISKLLKLLGFYYTGLSKPRTHRVNKDGTPSPHHRHNCYLKSTTFLVPAPRKHRFVLFNTKGYRKQELLNKLGYEIVPY